MRSELIDVAIATKTWLTNTDRDVFWLESNGLVKDGYQISVRNRDDMKGGVLALIYGSKITATEIAQRKQRSFKVVHWMTFLYQYFKYTGDISPTLLSGPENTMQCFWMI